MSQLEGELSPTTLRATLQQSLQARLVEPTLKATLQETSIGVQGFQSTLLQAVIFSPPQGSLPHELGEHTDTEFGSQPYPDGYVIAWDGDEGAFVLVAQAADPGAISFLDLSDTPDSYAGADGLYVRVDGTELVFDEGLPGPQGEQGEQGEVGPVGAIGPAGPTGAAGPAGDIGPIGGFGGNSLAYIWNTGTVDTDPGDGKLRGNHATFASITRLYVSEDDAYGADIQPWLAQVDDSLSTVRGTLRIFQVTDSSKYMVFNVTGASVDLVGYHRLTVEPVVALGTIPNDEPVVLTFARTGDVGATGPAGAQGEQGPQGIQGEPGEDGEDGAPGAAGPAGAAGAPGADGDSAYQVALDEGFVGNEAAWLASLVGAQGIQGEPGPAGADGDDGAPGAQGDPGPTGATGARGGFGGDSVAYTYSSTTTDSDPGAGTLRLNNSTFASITQIFLDDLGQAGGDVQAWLATLDDSTNAVKGSLRLFKESDSTTFQDYQITAMTEATGYWKATVTPLVSLGTFTNGDLIIVSFARAGNVGAQGIQGIQGIQGDTGPAGADGDAADTAANINAASTKATPVGTDVFGYLNSEASFALVKFTATQLLAWLSTTYVNVAGDTMTGILTMQARVEMTNSNPIRMIDATNVAHGMTSVVALSEMYGNIGEEGAGGGLLFTGLSDTDQAGWRGRGVIGTPTPTATTAAVVLAGSKKNGTNHQALASNETVFATWNLATPVFMVKGNGAIGVGVTNTQGMIHAHDGVGGSMFVTKSAVAGTKVVIIPSGATGVNASITGMYNLDNSDGTQIGGMFTIPNPGSFATTIGGTTWTFSVIAGGEFSVIRTAGTDTAIIAMQLVWR